MLFEEDKNEQRERSKMLDGELAIAKGSSTDGGENSH